MAGVDGTSSIGGLEAANHVGYGVPLSIILPGARQGRPQSRLRAAGFEPPHASEAEADNDGGVGIFDLVALLANWGPCL